MTRPTSTKVQHMSNDKLVETLRHAFERQQQHFMAEPVMLRPAVVAEVAAELETQAAHIARLTSERDALQQALADTHNDRARLTRALVGATEMCGLYADFVREHVAADDLEMDPYLPELEEVNRASLEALRSDKGGSA